MEHVFKYLKNLLNQYCDLIGDKKYGTALSVIRQFEEWHCDGGADADALYQSIGIQDDGEGIFEYAECDDSIDEAQAVMWQAVLSILLTVVSSAYQKEQNKYMPEDIECIQQSKIAEFFDYIQTEKSPQEVFNYFCKHVIVH